MVNFFFLNPSQLPIRDIKNCLVSSDVSLEMFSQFRSSMEEFIKVVEELSDSFNRLKVAAEKSQLMLERSNKFHCDNEDTYSSD